MLMLTRSQRSIAKMAYAANSRLMVKGFLFYY